MENEKKKKSLLKTLLSDTPAVMPDPDQAEVIGKKSLLRNKMEEYGQSIKKDSPLKTAGKYAAGGLTGFLLGGPVGAAAGLVGTALFNKGQKNKRIADMEGRTADLAKVDAADRSLYDKDVALDLSNKENKRKAIEGAAKIDNDTKKTEAILQDITDEEYSEALDAKRKAEQLSIELGKDVPVPPKALQHIQIWRQKHKIEE